MSVRWQVAKGHTRELTIQLICERGRLCIDIPERDCGVWAVTQQTDAGISDLLPEFPSETVAFQPAEVLLELLLLAGKGDADNHSNSSIPPAMWPDAARTIELAETIPRSVKRGRGIDLHQEEFSELGTFRGTMASLGCGIIMAGLFILFLATLVGGVARAAGWSFGERLAAIWPYAILTTLILFLILQLLPFLLPKESGNSDESKPLRSENP